MVNASIAPGRRLAIDDFDPDDWLRFVQMTLFARKWAKLGLDDDDLNALERLIMASPTRHPVVKNTGGLRKLRFAGADAGKCKRGAFRVGYVYFPDFGIVLLMTVYAKNESDDLTEADKQVIAALIREIHSSLTSEERPTDG